MNGCPCEPNGTDGLTCPDKDGRLLCQTSPSRARPSDRAIAQAFWDMANQANRHVRADELASSIITHAREIDASPEARAGDCDAATSIFDPAWPEGLAAGEVYELLCDDKGRNGGSWLRLLVAQDGDVHATMQDWEEIPEGTPSTMPYIRCRSYFGGGRNGRTHQALLWLAQAMRLDAADRLTTKATP